MANTVFHAFTLKVPGIASALISEIGVSSAYDASNPPATVPPTTHTKALWDTGASKSVVSSAFAKKLGLTPVGSSKVRHAGGESLSNTFLVNLFLPNKVSIHGVLVTEFDPHDHFDVIIGMDVIALGDFSVTNVGGKTCMSFRTPSIETIDYVVDAQRLTKASVGRNDPCPCNSGKKFKKCCGANL